MSDVVRRVLRGKNVEDILRQPRRQVLRHVTAVVGVGAGLAAFDRHTTASTRTGHVEVEVQIEEVMPEWRAVRGLGGGARANSQDFERARPVKRKFDLEYLGVRVSLHTLADGGSRGVHPIPTTHSEFGCRTQHVGEVRIVEVNARTDEGMVFSNNVVRALLSVGGQITIGQVVTGQALVFRHSRALENRQGGTWKSTHVNLVGRSTRCRVD